MTSVDPKIVNAWKNSKMRAISASLKNFKGCNVKYAYDQKTKVYSVSAVLDGKAYIITTKIGPNSVEMMLLDKQGNFVEHMAHVGSQLTFRKA
jgi:hypothetical protein